MESKSMGFKEFNEKYMNAEALQKKYEQQDNAFLQMDILVEYLIENKCTIYDLIQAHKNKNK